MRLNALRERLETSIDAREEELRRAEAFLDSVVENIPNMVFVKSAEDLRFVRFNRAGEELLGYSRSDLLGKNEIVLRLIHERGVLPYDGSVRFVKAARESEEKQTLLELARARGVELSERRAARAVASGRGDELRRRLERAATG